jgi:hypothetical protein
MKYITNVQTDKGVKHIIDCGNGNEEILQPEGVYQYGDKKGLPFFQPFYELKVFKDFTFMFTSNSHRSTHLAQIVVGIEKVKFIVEHLKGKNHE